MVFFLNFLPLDGALEVVAFQEMELSGFRFEMEFF